MSGEDSDGRSCPLTDQLWKHLHEGPPVDEVGFIQTSSSFREAFVRDGKKLGIYSTSVRQLYLESYRMLMGALRSGSASETDPKQLLRLTEAVLIVQAECSTAWNIRKRLISRGHLCSTCDLLFADIILKLRPKSAEVFIHRRWVLKHIFKQNPIFLLSCLHCKEAVRIVDQTTDIGGSVYLKDLVQRELIACSTAAELYKNNYFAWTHRLYILALLNTSLFPDCHLELLESEAAFSAQWVERNVSQFCGMHYRLKVLASLWHCFEDKFSASKASTCDVEQNAENLEHFIVVVQSRELLETYPDHEAIWNYQRGILCLVILRHVKMSSLSWMNSQDESSDDVLCCFDTQQLLALWCKNQLSADNAKKHFTGEECSRKSQHLLTEHVSYCGLCQQLLWDELSLIARLSLHSASAKFCEAHSRWLKRLLHSHCMPSRDPLKQDNSCSVFLHQPSTKS